uniref:Carboxylic ester hydrolase n=1 Tax=Holotrichia parallela TaxID=93412 RepID=A0A6M3GUD6_HOLPA|nr:juvenile hormone esterase [Holotrichia parallela]
MHGLKLNAFEAAMLLTFMAQTFLVSSIQNCDDNSPVTKTKYGEARGTIMKSRKGKLFAAFKGLPYAEPPIGELRFRAPKEIVKWSGIRNATEEPPVCIQQDFLFNRSPTVEGSEDCLYINVYSPKQFCRPRKIAKLVPVLVFIHYGAFIAGDSRSDIIGPEYLMDNDVVVVTFNYRLGVMGFLSTYDDEAPGNWAFKDQVAALKWIQNNILFFGGNKKKITIAGQSAGAGSVHHHVLSPSSKGLFQSAITMSGTALGLWAKPATNENFIVTNITALSVGCNRSDTKSMVECLRNVPAIDLVNAVNVFRQFLKSEPLMPYSPAIEQKSEKNPEPFITEDPINIIRKGNFHNVPWIIGVVSNEGILRGAPFVRQEDLLDKINSDFDTIKSLIGLSLSIDPSKVDWLWSHVKDFYFNSENTINSTNSITGLVNLYSDRAFLYPAYQTIKLHKRMGHKHIFVYNFDYKGKYSYGDLFAATPNEVDYEWGVSHCDDLLYLLYSPGRFSKYQLPDLDLKVSEYMVSLFLNFITYRDPTPKQLFGEKQLWEELPDEQLYLNEEDFHFLDISGSFEKGFYHVNITNGFYTPRMKFWENKPLLENKYFNNLTSIK